MKDIRALLGNEAGGGRGHVTTLAAVARALGPGIAKIGALGRLDFATELSCLCTDVVKAPLLARQTAADRPFALKGNATFGDTLAEIGLDDPKRVRRGLLFWRNLIIRHDISLLVADLAPLAMRAACGLRDEGWSIRIISIGTGYYSPPASLLHFPVILPDHDRITRSEDQTLAVLNAVGAEGDLAPLPRLSALYAADLPLATGFDWLDPYLAVRPVQDRIAPLTTAPLHPAGQGNEVFVYFSTTELQDEVLVRALETLPFARRGFLPQAPPEVRQRLAASGMVLLDQPATTDEIAARSRLIVHAAPHGTVCLAALAGLPQFGVPQHLEQLFNARQGEAMGVLTHALPGNPDMADRIAAAYGDAAMAGRARALASHLRRDHPADPIAALAARLAPELAAARAALP
ncbi:MAG: hypothetical protein NTW20_09910 [Rhodobacterales bacterium]|nr:hypothetical protein [Rhodobacterales bacterium]